MLLNGRMEKNSWTNLVRKIVLCTGKEERNNLSIINRRKAN